MTIFISTVQMGQFRGASRCDDVAGFLIRRRRFNWLNFG